MFAGQQFVNLSIASGLFAESAASLEYVVPAHAYVFAVKEFAAVSADK